MTAQLSPALTEQSKHYPARFKGRVPKTITMLKNVSPSLLVLQCAAEWRGVVANQGQNYPAFTNIHGAVAAVMPDGKKLGVKPDEFDVTEWHESPQ